MRIGQNIDAMMSVRQWGIHAANVSKSIFRLSSGKRINSAADDPAGMVRAEKLRTQIRAMEASCRTNQIQQDFLNIEEGKQMSTQSLLQRMRELSVGLSSDSLTEEAKNSMVAELKSYMEELVDSTKKSTGFDIVAFDSGAMKGQIAFIKGDKAFVNGSWINSSALRDVIGSSDYTEVNPSILEEGDEERLNELVNGGESEEGGEKGLIEYFDDLIKRNMGNVSQIGAQASRLVRNLESTTTQAGVAQDMLSRLEDIDFAEEMINFVKEKCLAQASVLMASQANARPERVMELLMQPLELF